MSDFVQKLLQKCQTIHAIGLNGIFWTVVSWLLYCYYFFRKTPRLEEVLQEKLAANRHKQKQSANPQNGSPLKMDASHAADKRSPVKHNQDKAEYAKNIYRFVALAGRYHFYQPNCVMRCLVMQRILSYRKIESKIIFGVKITKDANVQSQLVGESGSGHKQLAGHCWVMVGDAVVSDHKNVMKEYTAFI